MVMYDNEYKTKETKNITKDKIKPQQLHPYARVRPKIIAKLCYTKLWNSLPGSSTSYKAIRKALSDVDKSCHM